MGSQSPPTLRSGLFGVCAVGRTKSLKPLVSVSLIGDSANQPLVSVSLIGDSANLQAATRLIAEPASLKYFR
jgi:hypothetical protein